MFVGLKRWRACYIYCTAMESVAFWSLWLSPLVNIPQSTSQALFSTHISQLQRYIPPLIHFFADTLWKLDYWNLDWYLYVYYGCSLIHVPHLLWEMNVGLQQYNETFKKIFSLKKFSLSFIFAHMAVGLILLCEMNVCLQM